VGSAVLEVLAYLELRRPLSSIVLSHWCCFRTVFPVLSPNNNKNPKQKKTEKSNNAQASLSFQKISWDFDGIDVNWSGLSSRSV
jgi:hypothetical protein